jgi:S1-C subfamily serine protease
MPKYLTYLIYVLGGTTLGFGLFMFVKLMVQMLNVTGEDLLKERRTATQSEISNELGVIPLKRRRGPRIWVKQTNNWGPKTAVSKRNEFPGYNDPIPRSGIIKRRRSKTRAKVGSALAIYPNGVWLTAKHVIEGCKKLVVQAGLKNGKPANLVPKEIIFHPNADLAVIITPHTDYKRQAFRLSGSDDVVRDAFHIGFPKGKPGAVHSRFLGRMKVRRGRKRNSRENVAVWAEITRIPNISGSLGGISGGPVVDATGTLIGVNSAGSVRRGRILTSRPSSLKNVIRSSGHKIPNAKKRRPAILELTKKDYPSYAKAAIQDRRVVRVICRKKL